jgi:hypothetical protein
LRFPLPFSLFIIKICLKSFFSFSFILVKVLNLVSITHGLGGWLGNLGPRGLLNMNGKEISQKGQHNFSGGGDKGCQRFVLIRGNTLDRCLSGGLQANDNRVALFQGHFCFLHNFGKFEADAQLFEEAVMCRPICALGGCPGILGQCARSGQVVTNVEPQSGTSVIKLSLFL